MDPIAHTFTGAALAAAGLRRASRLATPALILGANAPDVDILAALGPDYSALAFRRGWTHGILAIAIWPFVVTGLLLLYDRLVRIRSPGLPAVQPRALLVVAAVAVVSHPTLDWLNNYGLRWLMPFDGRWFYGDALFIVDPWVWLILGGVLCVEYSRKPRAIAAWTAFWLLASALVVSTAGIPVTARILWFAGIGAVVAGKAVASRSSATPEVAQWTARAALGLTGAYMALSLAANVPARAQVARALERAGIGPAEQIMVGPVPANPFAGTVVAETANAYYTGEWHWLEKPRFHLSGTLPKPPRTDVVDRAAQTPEARRFLTWSRFPLVDVETRAGGYRVRFSDARYGQGRLAGPTVLLDADLGPVAEPAAR